MRRAVAGFFVGLVASTSLAQTGFSTKEMTVQYTLEEQTLGACFAELFYKVEMGQNKNQVACTVELQGPYDSDTFVAYESIGEVKSLFNWQGVAVETSLTVNLQRFEISLRLVEEGRVEKVHVMGLKRQLEAQLGKVLQIVYREKS